MPLTPAEEAELAALEAREPMGSRGKAPPLDTSVPIRDPGRPQVARTQTNPSPAGQERPDDARRQNRSPAESAYPTTGASVGGAVGATVGTPFGIPGRTVGSAVGGFLGDMLGQQYGATKRPYTGFLDALLPNPGQAAGQGAVQGAITAATGGLGKGAVKLGFPKIGALLGAGTPRGAVVNAAPEAATGVSKPALQMVDAAAQASPQAAVQAAATGSQQAAQGIPWAMSKAPQMVPGMAANAQGLSSISKLGIPTPSLSGGRLAQLLQGLSGQGAQGFSQVAPVGIRGGARAAQTVSGLLGDQAFQPLSNSPALPALGDLLKALAQNRSR